MDQDVSRTYRLFWQVDWTQGEQPKELAPPDGMEVAGNWFPLGCDAAGGVVWRRPCREPKPRKPAKKADPDPSAGGDWE